MTKKKKQSKKKSGKIVFKPNMNIGAMSAEEDEKFLNQCYIETGDFEVLSDFDSSKCILLGRTGSGKSASIKQIVKRHHHVIEIDPHTLALNFISGSDILNFFSKLGVKLDIFYRLLWQHVICVELLKFHFKLREERDYKKFKDWVAIFKKDKATEFATAYLEKWNSKFWAEREERIKEITENLEQKITAAVGLTGAGIRGGLSATDESNTEIKTEIVHKAQKVVNDIQMQELAQVINLLDTHLLTDANKRHFITIDGLDEDWVDDELRYKLIRALIEAIKKFRRVKNLKIIVSLRTDLLERVYMHTRDSGFQEEKYEDLNVRIAWSTEQIKSIIDKRIGTLFQHQYSGRYISFYDVFPKQLRNDNKTTFDFIVQRTLLRPRDAIAFVNTILEHAVGHKEISNKVIFDAERAHSERRTQAVYQEWFAEYPKLKICSQLLYNMPQSFDYDAIKQRDLDCIGDALLAGAESNDKIEKMFRRQLGEQLDYVSLHFELINLLFKVGFIGVRIHASHPFIFSSSNQATLNQAQITSQTRITIHPMFRSAFGTMKIKGAAIGDDNSIAANDEIHE